MQTSIPQHSQTQAPKLRALIEIVDGELKIFPIADSDEHAARIIDSLRFVIEDAADR